VDSKLVHHASRAYQADLLQAGVQVMLYEQGLLHTKSITIDEDLALFGSLNLDPRSLRLNFEITLAVYDRQFSKSLTELQNKYLGRSRRLTLDECRRRSGTTRFVENTARLLGPLL
jgi:cardiolipin synthase